MYRTLLLRGGQSHTQLRTQERGMDVVHPTPYYSLYNPHSGLEKQGVHHMEGRVDSLTFKNCQFSGYMLDAYIWKSTFKSCDFRAPTISHSNFYKSLFENTAFLEGVVQYSLFHSVVFDWVQMEGTIFRNCVFYNCTFRGTTSMVGVLFVNCTFDSTEHFRGDIEYRNCRLHDSPEHWIPDYTTGELMAQWIDGVTYATDGCMVEPDGVCPHGCPSVLLQRGMI